MIVGLSLPVFTALHIAISLAGLGAGFVAVGAMLAGQWLGGWTAVFLIATALTSITGFLFPLGGFTPAHGVGLASLAVLAVAAFALYGRGLAGRWRTTYAVTSVAALYLNSFVGLVQTFQKQPTLMELAPDQTGPVFVVGQALLLAAFILLGVLAARRLPDLR